MTKNKYDSVKFRVVLDLNPVISQVEKGNIIKKNIKLKRNRLKDDLFAYVRMSLIQKFEKDNSIYKMKKGVGVASPVDIEFELLVLAYVLNLMKSIYQTRFTTTSKEDNAILESEDAPYRKRVATQYRQMSK